jgi:flagellar biosynthesis protein FlhB
MFQLLHILTVILVAIAMALSLAHVLELPGKLRLDRDTYLAALALLMQLFMTQTGTTAFWLMLMAFIALGLMHLIFWLMTQPVNKLWLASEKLSPASARFFSANTAGERDTSIPDWTTLRDRWEFSHVLRAVLAGTAFVLLLFALSFLSNHP